MDSLHREMMTGFGQGDRPHESELVLWNGFDQLVKEDAVRFYSGKTWPDVFAYLRGLKDEPLFRAAYFLEEWSVLSPPALAYYARAHLEFLWETLVQTQPDEEFTFHLLGQLYQVFYMHKGSPFNSLQTGLLRRMVQRIAEKAATAGSFEYYADDIKDWAEKVLAEMEAYYS
jgi:hypothetical protein